MGAIMKIVDQILAEYPPNEGFVEARELLRAASDDNGQITLYSFYEATRADESRGNGAPPYDESVSGFLLAWLVAACIEMIGYDAHGRIRVRTADHAGGLAYVDDGWVVVNKGKIELLEWRETMIDARVVELERIHDTNCLCCNRRCDCDDCCCEAGNFFRERAMRDLGFWSD